MGIGLTCPAAHAQTAAPGDRDDAPFAVMNLLAAGGLHDTRDERWNAYGQFTHISSYKFGFPAAYSNVGGSNHSLSPAPEYSYTYSATLFFGLALWRGGELYVVPEVIAERPLSGLAGIGGAIQNFELQKQGSETPQLYRSRAFLRQTFDLGGERVADPSAPMQLATGTGARRLVFTIGNFSILDVLDRNSVSGDPRQTFLNMAFMTYASWDFPADARGYSWGATAELRWDDWALRVGRMMPPQLPNVLPLDFHFWKFYGDELEVEHDHRLFGLPGAVRLLGYRNRVFSGRFDDAIAAFEAAPATHNAAACATAGFYDYGSQNANAPGLCWVRRPNVKIGIGASLEQWIADGVGVFFRGMYSDGQSEVDAFNSADRSISAGAIAKGALWRRPLDAAGIGFGMSWISSIHAQYLAMGGVDGFVGDGRLRQAGEGVAEAFYSVNLVRALWLTADYQFLWNPGFNADRGPVNILGGRVHAEF